MLAVALTVQANAEDYRDMKPLTLETPEMKAALVEVSRGASSATTTTPARTSPPPTTPTTSCRRA